MFTEQFFELLLNFGDEWVVKQVTTNLETNEVEIYVEFLAIRRFTIMLRHGGGDIWTQCSLRLLSIVGCRE